MKIWYKVTDHEVLAWNFTSLSSCVSNRNARHMGKNLHLQAIIINPQMGGSSLWLLTNEFFKLLIIGPSQAKNNYSFVFPSWFNPGGHPYITSPAVFFCPNFFNHPSTNVYLYEFVGTKKNRIYQFDLGFWPCWMASVIKSTSHQARKIIYG